MNANDTRNEALNILREVADNGLFISDAAGKAALPQKGASDLDIRFILNLVRGTVEHESILKAVLKRLVTAKPGKLKSVIKRILLLGLYELLFLNNKAYAVVNEYVRLAKRKGFQGLSGFVNAVLRRAVSEKEALLQSLSAEEASGLSPEILKYLSDALGREDALAFGRYVIREESKKLTVRRNISACTAEAFVTAIHSDDASAEPLEFQTWMPEEMTAGLPDDEIYSLKTEKPIPGLQAFQNGCFYVQDVSAWAAFRSLGAVLAPETAVLDLCAAPGGKTFQLMDIAAEKGVETRFTACDISESRLERLKENAERMHFSNIEILKNDAAEACDAFTDRFGVVLADVPCSGLGDLSGKPEIRFHVSEEEFRKLTAIQGRILENAAHYVKAEGILQYSTCTLTRMENQEQIRRFLTKHPEFTLIDERTLIPGVNTPGDGFYYARMKRSGKAVKD